MTARQKLPPSDVGLLIGRPRKRDVALKALTHAANHGLLWFGIAGIGWLCGGRPRRAALRAAGSLAGASFISNSVLKPLVNRRRPDPARTALARRIARKPWTSSFPSGHSASAGAFATGAALELPLSALGLGPLAGAVAYSRVHVGVHHRSDVVVGAAVGIGVALLGRTYWPVKPHGPAQTAPAQAPALPEGEGLAVVVNAASGSSDGAADEIAAALPKAVLVTWDPQTPLEDTIGTGMRALGVAGGDGTVATVAQAALDRELPLAVFPAGTLNHFAKALRLDTVAITASAVEAGSAGGVDVGTINGDAFLNTASIGAYPDLVDRRDRLSKRMGKWPAAGYALLRTLRRQQPMDVVINGDPIRVWELFVGNGLYTPRGLAVSWREDLADRVLDVQFLRADRKFARTLGVIGSVVGLLDRTPAFGEVRAPEVDIDVRSAPVPAAHDGETTDPIERVELRILPDRLTVYRPE